MQIQKATAADIPDLCDLLTELFSQEVEFTPDQNLQANGLAQIILNREAGVIMVARNDGGDVIGMINLLFTVSTALGARVALLEDLVVAPSERGLGVGTQLLTEGISLAKEMGCKRITLLTDASNEGAQHLYARHGFTRSTMLPMRLSLT